ncbi:putative homing endonuclease, mitochodrion [Tuber indicum]|nr:putative homing endonuclease, mitochodrion [Tuber indicum]
MVIFITGFSDAEASFIITLDKNKKYKTGYQVRCRYSICIHKKDLQLLNKIKDYFGVGGIVMHKESIYYTVTNLNELMDVIILHFEKYPLITQKRADYELFKKAIILLKNKEHLTLEGIHKILSIKASINRGLSESLNIDFPNVTPQVHSQSSSGSKLGKTIRLRFQITQHTRDEQLIKSLINYFGCGSYISSSSGKAGYFQKIIPFFLKYPLKGAKVKDFEDFCKVAELISNKEHLTEKGLNKILQIKSGMNFGRE